MRRNWWIVVWALSAVAVYLLAPKLPLLGDSAMLLVPALVLLPIILSIAEDTTQRAIGEVIEEPEADERLGVWSQLWRAGLLGAIVGLLIGLVVFALAEALFGSAISPRASPSRPD